MHVSENYHERYNDVASVDAIVNLHVIATYGYNSLLILYLGDKKCWVILVKMKSNLSSINLQTQLIFS